ncbi:MAG: hypothetical protein K2X47_15325 [Bdellovibrionales bacterium]|nr:hypothetical protein [Bdellovibrionales bacterium]
MLDTEVVEVVELEVLVEVEEEELEDDEELEVDVEVELVEVEVELELDELELEVDEVELELEEEDVLVVVLDEELELLEELVVVVGWGKVGGGYNCVVVVVAGTVVDVLVEVVGRPVRGGRSSGGTSIPEALTLLLSKKRMFWPHPASRASKITDVVTC